VEPKLEEESLFQRRGGVRNSTDSKKIKIRKTSKTVENNSVEEAYRSMSSDDDKSYIPIGTIKGPIDRSETEIVSEQLEFCTTNILPKVNLKRTTLVPKRADEEYYHTLSSDEDDLETERLSA
jgi:hypothetical protein